MRRVPYHGAVSIRIPDARAEAARAALASVAGVAAVEVVAKANGTIQLRALPKGATPIAADVAARLRESSIATDELFVERGKLDDVFRQITTGETVSHA